MRKPDNAEVGLGEDCEENLVADVGYIADLYIVNQEITNLIREAHTGDAPFALYGSRPILLSVAESLTS